MTDDTRLDELLTSPLDQPESFRVWWPLIVGVAIGIAGALIGYRVAYSGDEAAAPSTTTTTAASTTTTTVTAGEAAFPPGYSPVSGLVAVQPFAAILHEDEVHIAFNTAVRRGFDETQAAPFNGGRWVLETASGASVESIVTATSFDAPGSFTVAFPWTEEAPPEPTRLRLLEGLTTSSVQAEIELPVTGIPTTANDIVVGEIPTATVMIDELTVTEDEVVLTWSADAPVGASFSVFLSDTAGFDVAQYYERTGFFPGFEQRLPELTSGTVTLPRDPVLAGGLDSAIRLRIFGFLEYTISFPASAEFDVTELTVIAR